MADKVDSKARFHFITRSATPDNHKCKVTGEYSSKKQLKNNHRNFGGRVSRLRIPDEEAQRAENASFDDVVDCRFAHFNDQILFQTLNIGSVRCLVVWDVEKNSILNATSYWSTAPSSFHIQPSCVVSRDNNLVAVFVPPFPCFGGEECVLYTYQLVDDMKDFDLVQREHAGREGESFVAWSLDEFLTQGATIGYYVQGRAHDHAIYQLRIWDLSFKSCPRKRNGKQSNPYKYLEWKMRYKIDLPDGYSWGIDGFVSFDFARDKSHFVISTPTGLTILYQGSKLRKKFKPKADRLGPCMCLFHPCDSSRFILCRLHEGLCELWGMDETGIFLVQSVYIVQTPVEIKTFRFSSDGSMTAFGTSHGKIIVCRSSDLSQVTTVTSPASELSTTSVTFSNSCEEIAAGYSDGVVRIWQLPLPLFSLQHMCRKEVLKIVPMDSLKTLPLSNSVLKYIMAPLHECKKPSK